MAFTFIGSTLGLAAKALLIGGSIWGTKEVLEFVNDTWEHNQSPALNTTLQGLGFVLNVGEEAGSTAGHLAKGAWKWAGAPDAKTIARALREVKKWADAVGSAPKIPDGEGDSIQEILHGNLTNASEKPSAEKNEATKALIGDYGPDALEKHKIDLTKFAANIKASTATMSADDIAKMSDLDKAKKIAQAAKDAGLDAKGLNEASAAFASLGHSDDAAADGQKNGKSWWMASAMLKEMAGSPATSVDDLDATKHPEKATDAFDAWKKQHATDENAAVEKDASGAKDVVPFSDNYDGKGTLGVNGLDHQWADAAKEKIKSNGAADFTVLEADGITQLRIKIDRTIAGTYTIVTGTTTNGSDWSGALQSREFMTYKAMEDVVFITGLDPALSDSHDGREENYGPAEHLLAGLPHYDPKNYTSDGIRVTEVTAASSAVNPRAGFSKDHRHEQAVILSQSVNLLEEANGKPTGQFKMSDGSTFIVSRTGDTTFNVRIVPPNQGQPLGVDNLTHNDVASLLDMYSGRGSYAGPANGEALLKDFMAHPRPLDQYPEYAYESDSAPTPLTPANPDRRSLNNVNRQPTPQPTPAAAAAAQQAQAAQMAPRANPAFWGGI